MSLAREFSANSYFPLFCGSVGVATPTDGRPQRSAASPISPVPNDERRPSRSSGTVGNGHRSRSHRSMGKRLARLNIVHIAATSNQTTQQKIMNRA